jgi:hypothetical protein
MFVVQLMKGENVSASEGDQLTINQETGVLTVSAADGFEETPTHCSPSAWHSVTHRDRGTRVHPALV